MSAMNLDINVDEHTWKTLPPSNPPQSLLPTLTPSNNAHPLLVATSVKPSTQKTDSTAQSGKPQDFIDPEEDPLRAFLNDPLSAPSTMLKKAAQKDPEAKTASFHPQLGEMPSQPETTPDSTPQPTPDSASDRHTQILSSLRRRFEFWPEKVPRILSKFTTSTSIAVSNDFLNEGNLGPDPTDPAVQHAQQAALAAKGKQQAPDQASSRLEEMENERAGTKEAKSYLSQKDFIKHIEEQHTKLLDAWEKGERVIALRIVIKCAEMLANMTIPQFYPSMYVILTRILDTFGDLVFNRIRERGIQNLDPVTKQVVYGNLPATFRASDVCSSAVETCKNWFFKTICIRELLPRLYIDLSLIKCYRFLEDEQFAANITRVCQQIRGVGDPLTASYLRAYIATKALDISYSFHEVLPPPSQRYHVAPTYRVAIKNALSDWLIQHNHSKQTQCANVPIVKSGDITPQMYFSLMAPSIEWIMQLYYYTDDSEAEFVRFLKEVIVDHDDLILLHAMINAFNPQIVHKHLKTVLGLVHGMLDPLREKYNEYQEIIDHELGDGSDSDNDSDKKGKKTMTDGDKKPKQSSHTASSVDYQKFTTLHHYVEDFATNIFATLCKKLIMLSQEGTMSPQSLQMTSALLNALWSGICDCPFKEHVNEHSPTLALLICVHGRWNDTSVLLKSGLQTLQSKRFSLTLHNSSSLMFASDQESIRNDIVEYENTLATIENIFALTPHLMQLLTSDYILSILDQLQRPQRVQMSTILLQRYRDYIISLQNGTGVKQDTTGGVKSLTEGVKMLSWKTNDSVLIHTLHELCHHVHTSISSVSSRSEIEAISTLCQYVILSIDYGKDVETQLSTYVSFRASLSELPSILALLVYQVNKLAMSALQLMNEKKSGSTAINPSSHNRKTAGFVKAAIAFCHITIPSLPHSTNSHIYQRIMLFLTSSQTSIANNLLPQAEALITAAIQQLSLLSTTINTQEGAQSYIKHMSIHDFSLQVTATIQTILSTIAMLPPVGGQWLRLLGVLLNILEKEQCPCVDIIASPLIYVNSLYVISTMCNNPGVADNVSNEEQQAIAAATKMIISKLLFSLKVLFTTGGGIVAGMSKEESTQISNILSAQTTKYPPQLICDTLTTVASAFFHVMKLDAYTATIVFSVITSIKEILKSHPYSLRTIEHFVQVAKDKQESQNTKEAKMYRDFAKKLHQFIGK